MSRSNLYMNLSISSNLGLQYMTYCFISIVFLSSLIIRLAQSLNIYFLITFSRPLSNPKHSHRNRLDSIRPTNLYLLFVFSPVPWPRARGLNSKQKLGRRFTRGQETPKQESDRLHTIVWRVAVLSTSPQRVMSFATHYVRY